MSVSGSATLWAASTATALSLPEAGALDDDERRRAARISHAGERERFIASRALLRLALTSAADGSVQPSDWRYVTARGGKPAVAGGLPRIAFNLSHAADCVAAATGTAFHVGIDVEGMWRDAGSEVVEDVLAPRERHALRGLDPDREWEDFIRIWTIKEACAKAAGAGVGMDFKAIEVSLDPARVAAHGIHLEAGAMFDVFARSLAVAGRCYHLAAAAIVERPGRTDFRLRVV